MLIHGDQAGKVVRKKDAKPRRGSEKPGAPDNGRDSLVKLPGIQNKGREANEFQLESKAIGRRRKEVKGAHPKGTPPSRKTKRPSPIDQQRRRGHQR